MTEGDSRRIVRGIGRCNFLSLLVLATIAFVLGVFSTSYCAFVDREVVLKRDIRDICGGLEQGQDQCFTFLASHGVGFWGWQATVPKNGQVCFSYTQWIPELNTYVTLEPDNKFYSSRAFGIVASVFGGLGLAVLTVATCAHVKRSVLFTATTCFGIATLFQGLTLLIMRSNVCQQGFFDPFYAGHGVSDLVDSVSCGLSTGSKMAIASTVLYFWCQCCVGGAIPPGTSADFEAHPVDPPAELVEEA